jgi:hypothetical protein
MAQPSQVQPCSEPSQFASHVLFSQAEVEQERVSPLFPARYSVISFLPSTGSRYLNTKFKS